MCRGFDPLFSLWQDRARSFWGTFSHPPTAKLSFGVQKLPIFTKIDLFGPKFNFSSIFWGPIFSGQRHTPIRFQAEYPPPPPPPPPPGPRYLVKSRVVGLFEECRLGSVKTYSKLSIAKLSLKQKYICVVGTVADDSKALWCARTYYVLAHYSAFPSSANVLL